MLFELHATLAKDTDIIGEFETCLALLSKENIGPWVILVPKYADIRELHHLEVPQQHQVLKESQAVMQALEHLYQPKKLNLAALGNMVPQLHIHHVPRFENDVAWPAPIWGKTTGELRSEEDKKQVLMQLRQAFAASQCKFIPAEK